MDIRTKIKMAIAFAGISASEVARRWGKSPQSFNQRNKTGKYTITELEEIARAMGAEFECSFVFPDGTRV